MILDDSARYMHMCTVHVHDMCMDMYEFFIDRTLRSAFHASWAEIATRTFVIRKANAQRKQRTNIQIKLT